MNSSFFDDDEQAAKTQGFWQNPQKFYKIREAKFESNPEKYFRSNLYKRTKKTNEFRSLQFTMFDNRLSYVKDSVESGYILLDNHVLQTFESKSSSEFRYGFKLIKNRHFTEFYTESKEKQNEWVKRLKKYCILNNFFSDYSAISILGKGNFAKVYKVKCKTTGKLFAAKIFEKSEVAKSEKLKKALISELKVLRMVDHPYVLKMHQVYEGEQHVYLIFEIMYGRELFDRVVSQRYTSEESAAKILKRLLEVLKYLEKKEILHRDIKLENILLEFEDDECSIKLADFGLAVTVKDFDPSVRCGTPGYVAPELLNEKEYDFKADIFSVGVVLFILLSGSAPFPGKSFDEIISRNKKCEVKFNTKYWVDVSPEAIAVVKSMLHPDPKERASWKDLIENDWLKRITSREENVLVCPDYIESSNCFEEALEEIPKNRHEIHGSVNADVDGAKKEDYHDNDVQSINEEEKMIKRMNSESKPAVNMEKRSSIRILDSFEVSKTNSQGSNQLKKFAIAKNMLNRLKESKDGENSGFTTKGPFDFSTYAQSQINSFYKKTAFLNSFHKEDSTLSKEESTSRKHISPVKSDQLNDQSIKNQQVKEVQKKQIIESSKNFPIEGLFNEDIPTTQINEFFRESLSLSQKLKTLNEKPYQFLPSFQSRQKPKISLS